MPQFAPSLARFTHVPLQAVWPALHAAVQLPDTQLAVPPVGAAHALPHVPQFATSVVRFTHAAPQAVVGALHAKPQEVPLHVGVPFTGAAGHAVQLAPHVATPQPLTLEYFQLTEDMVAGVPAFVARTGYTGEPGVEIMCPWAEAPRVWDALTAGPAGAAPAGLVARDTLRTEMGYALHGHELSPEITPVQARAGWAVGWNKPAFFGREALLAEKENGPARRLYGLRATGRGVPRADCDVLTAAGGDRIGLCTSGTFSPTLKQGIALALLDTASGVAKGDRVVVDVRGRDLECEVVIPPFVPSHV